MILLKRINYFRRKILYAKLFPISKIRGKSVIYVHINKTGGTSINSVLQKNKLHLTVKEIIDFIGKKRYTNSFKFVVVRNPYDRVVSQYLHRVKTNQCDMKDNPIEFNDWVKKVYDEPKDPFYHDKQYKMFYSQLDWLKNDKDKIDIDLILRFENLNEDFNKFAQKIGLNKELPRLNTTKKSKPSYKDYYNVEARAIVSAYFKEDIEYFNYKF